MIDLKTASIIYWCLQMFAMYYLGQEKHTDQSLAGKIKNSKTFWLIFLIAHLAWAAAYVPQGHLIVLLPSTMGCLITIYFLVSIRAKRRL